MAGRRRRLIGGFLAAGALLVALVVVVGPERMADSLARTDPVTFSLGFLAVLGAYWCWSEALAQLLDRPDRAVGGARYRAAYMSAEFVKKVVPAGQAAGPLFLAYLVGRETDTPYETTLAATTVLSFVNIGASLVLASASLAWLVAAGTPPSGPVFYGLLLVLVVSVGAVFGLAVLVRTRRSLLEATAMGLAATVRRTLGRVSGRVEGALAPDRVRAAVERVSGAVDAVLAEWQAVAVAGALCVGAWALAVAPIYTSVLALGVHVPYALVAFVVPLVVMINVVPLPGGFGGFDVAVASLLSVLGGLSLPTAAAALFLYRLSNYWFVLLIGGLSSFALSVGVSTIPPIAPEEGEETLHPGSEADWPDID